MKANELEYKGINYKIVFNMNVMEAIQEEYGSLAEWVDMTDKAKEPNMKAVIFGLREMINEGIDIDNEENEGVEGYTPKKFLTSKQVGRMMMEVDFIEAVQKMNDAVIDSTKTEEKNL